MRCASGRIEECGGRSLVLMNIHVRTIRTPVRFWQTRNYGLHCFKTVLSLMGRTRSYIKPTIITRDRAAVTVVLWKDRKSCALQAPFKLDDLSDVVKKNSCFSTVVYECFTDVSTAENGLQENVTFTKKIKDRQNVQNNTPWLRSVLKSNGTASK